MTPYLFLTPAPIFKVCHIVMYVYGRLQPQNDKAKPGLLLSPLSSMACAPCSCRVQVAIFNSSVILQTRLFISPDIAGA